MAEQEPTLGMGTAQVGWQPDECWAPWHSLVGRRTADHGLGGLAGPQQEDGGLHTEELLTPCHNMGQLSSGRTKQLVTRQRHRHGGSLALPDDF